MTQDSNEPQLPRRKFLKSGSALTAGAAALGTTRALRGAEPQENNSETVRIGLVGAGGRGSGAVNDSLTINENIELTAIADLEPAKLESLRKSAGSRHEGKVKVANDKMYSGIDAYRRILDDPDIDVVMFATPPGFRPQYIAEAVDAGKHVFAEKPTCVDPAGYKICLSAHEQAEKNGTAIVTGTQYRRQTNYKEAIKRLSEGEIGDIIAATMRYCSTGIWFRNRREEMSDTEYQIFNWMHFIWLSGDQIAEQAVHNIDTMNWIMGGPPESAYGSGGRFTRPEGSEMWDNIEVDYVYPGNRLVSFMCRQIPGTESDNSNTIYCTGGRCTIYGGNRGASLVDRDGKEIWSMKGNIGDAYKQEHKDLIDSVRANKPIVELKKTAESSMTAVLGRMAAYTGKNVEWDFATNESTLDLFPKDFDIKGTRPEPEFAVPGKTKLV
ncbi:MAG: Gfo/Idh/MocA family oxidoreductase [Rubripirellula sp.]|nr:Gfo/Idh/MocA family oxidoreductase [Rubripirellula sp.]